MTTSRYIAGLMGPLFLVIGLSLLLNHAMFPVMVEQLSLNYAVVFLAGVVALVAGIAVVRAHNVWEGSWRVIVTILGWLAIVGGIVRMLFPDRAAEVAGGFATGGPLWLGAVVTLALGGFLTYKGYEKSGD